jgi:tetratricopeptide (TPR) repeat protein
LSWLAFRWWKPAPYKTNSVAQGWYDKGTDALRNGAALQATGAFEQAVASDDKFALAHAQLAEAWFELDYSDKAKDELLKVQSLAPDHSRLAASDALHLEAINATVSQDFPGAVKAYSELVKLSPDDPQVYVDLGRAYEKTEEPNKAIASYNEASKRDPQYAVAFLRAGGLYSRQLDQAMAMAAFDRAETIYKAVGNFEGQAEVSFQRGFLLDQTGKTEARQHLARALELAKTTNNDYQQVKTLQKLGDIEVDANNLALGRKYMLEAQTLAQTKDIDNLVKRGLIDLGSTYLLEGKYAEAEDYFQRSLTLSLEQKDPRNAARARLSLASAAERQSKSDQVIAYVEQALPFYKQGGYRKEMLQAWVLFARAKVQKGEYDPAWTAFEQVLKLAQALGDEAQAGLAHEDLGLILLKWGRHPEALQHFAETYRIAQSQGLKRNVYLSLIDRANCFWRLGQYEQARLALAEAAPFANQTDTPASASSQYFMTLARMALTQRDFPAAIVNSHRAFDLSNPNLPRTAIMASFTEGLAQAVSGSASGLAKCAQALQRARELGDPLMICEALVALAQAQLEARDAGAARKNSLEAQEISLRLRSPELESVSWLVAARASSSLGDLQKSQEYANNADKLLTGFQQLWGQDIYNSYLSRPDILTSRKQLNQLRAQGAKPQ